MKTSQLKHSAVFLVALLAIISLSGCKSSTQKTGNASDKNEIKGNISISGAFALYPLTVTWAEEFKKIHPNVNIDISAGGAGKGLVGLSPHFLLLVIGFKVIAATSPAMAIAVRIPKSTP